MSRFWSPIVERLEPYTPGEQPSGQDLIKLNTNENPYGPSPLALEAIRAAADDGLKLYPDPRATGLRSSIATKLDLDAEHIFVGNGSDEILAHSFNAFFREKNAVAFADVTYSFYKTYCKLYEVEHREIALDDGFQCNPVTYDGANGGVILANPNAPTGLKMELTGVEQILRQNPNIVVLVDEAYVDFGAESSVVLVPRYDNLVVVQTFSKSRSLAGLRVGFAVAQPHLIEALTRVKCSFNSYPVDRLALAGAQAAWEDEVWFASTRQKVIADRVRIAEQLETQGFKTLSSAANFIFASHEKIPAKTFAAKLRSKGILVRHFEQSRINNWLRISIGTSGECDALLDAARSILQSED